jgi:glycosyltransferase involved in cell wall biosynthesis
MRALFVDHLLAHKIEMVVPSPSVASTLRKLEPRLKDVPIHVIAHGIDFDVPKLPIPARNAAQPIRIVVLGRLSVQKGTELLREACEGLKPFAEVTLIGGGQNGARLAADCGWSHVERYELEALPELLKSLAPHAGLLASVVPETFSYTLSELWALGVPPIVSRLGSFVDRVTDGESGFLFDPEARSLVDLVKKLHAQPELLDTVAGPQRRGNGGRLSDCPPGRRSPDRALSRRNRPANGAHGALPATLRGLCAAERGLRADLERLRADARCL